MFSKGNKNVQNQLKSGLEFKEYEPKEDSNKLNKKMQKHEPPGMIKKYNNSDSEEIKLKGIFQI